MRLRIASYNVHRCIGRDGRLDVARTVSVLDEIDADVVGLQEVDAELTDDARHDLLSHARGLGYLAHHGVTLTRSDAAYGNALLSRAALVDVEHVEIGIPGYEPRGVLAGTLRRDDASLRIYVTHFGLRAAERRRQATSVGETLPKPLRRTVLLGDLNEWRPFERGLRALTRRFRAISAPPTFPARWPVIALDRILVSPDLEIKGLRTHRSRQARLASDHLPLVADVELA